MPKKHSPMTKVFALIAALFFAGDLTLQAQEIPEDSLVVDFANCMTGCLDFESQTGCEVLCGCTVERFKAALNQEQYNILNKELEEGLVSPENRNFLDDTALICVAEMDQVLEDLGLALPPPGEALPVPDDDG